jgi:hypothetical protein
MKEKLRTLSSMKAAAQPSNLQNESATANRHIAHASMSGH